jgi:hypothetical protein
MLLVSLLSGWLSFRIQQGRKQRQDVAVLEQMGAEVLYLNYGTPHWLVSLFGVDAFLDVSIVLFLPDSPVDDNGLAWLKRFPELHSLNLADTRITDAGLAYLRELTELRSLRLDRTQVSDAGLVHITNLSQIEELDLSGTQVTNACLGQFANLPRLWSLDVTHTQVTHAGIVERFGPNGPRFVVRY